MTRRELVRARRVESAWPASVRPSAPRVVERVIAFLSDGTVQTRCRRIGHSWGQWRLRSRWDARQKAVPELKRELDLMGWEVLR